MTPALLPGFRAHVHNQNQQPCILQSTDDDDFVQGMIIFGQGSAGRKRIHKHYRPHARRVKVEVEVETIVLTTPSDGSSASGQWRPQRRTIWAHAWLWSNFGSIDVEFRQTWTLEKYLSSTLAGPEPAGDTLRIEGNRQPDVEIEVDSSDYECETEKHESVQGDCGDLDVLSDCEHLDYEGVLGLGFGGW